MPDPRDPGHLPNLAAMVDRRLAEGRLDGYQSAGMPDDRDTWRIALAGLDNTAHGRRGASFPTLARDEQEAIVGQMCDGVLTGGPWERVPVHRAFGVCMRFVVSAYYAHPWAWNEIGFGGPAYPRGFMRLGGLAVREPYERRGATEEDPVRLIPTPDG